MVVARGSQIGTSPAVRHERQSKEGVEATMQAETKQQRPETTIASCYSPEQAAALAHSKLASRHAAPGVVVAGRYILDRKLGAGGMGSVWLAYDQSLQSFCALKVLHEEQGSNDELRIRFRREATVAARIRSEHVVSILQHGEWDGQPYIAMEYLEGEDLASRLDRTGRLGVYETCQLVFQLARGLGRAHARGIVHRDIKPANVLLTLEHGDQVAKLVDFGVAKEATCSHKGGMTLVGSFLGTPDYASPEQLRGRDVDCRSDLWSLAVLAFECLTGSRPFDDDSLAGTCAKILNGPAPSLCKADPLLPPALDAWWQRAVASDPNRRYQSAKEFADDFAVAAGRTPPCLAVAPSQAAATKDQGGLRATSKSRAYSRWLSWAALPLVGLALGGVALSQSSAKSGREHVAAGGLFASGSEAPEAIATTVVLAPGATDAVLHDIRKSVRAAVDPTAVGANHAPSGIRLACDVLEDRAMIYAMNSRTAARGPEPQRSR